MATHIGPNIVFEIFAGHSKLLIALGILVVLILLLRWYQMIDYKLERIR